MENGQVVDGSGTVIEGAYIDSDGTVYDGYANPVSSVEVEEVIDPKVENPGIALPPAENSEESEAGTVWDGTATDDGTAAEDTVSE